jgi:hypothetical protein
MANLTGWLDFTTAVLQFIGALLVLKSSRH